MLAEAITAARQAVAAAAPGDPERGGYLNNLYNVLSLDWERSGELATLTEAVRVARDAVEATPSGHRLRGMCLTALASATGELYDRTGNDALLAESVQASRGAVASVPGRQPRPRPLPGKSRVRPARGLPRETATSARWRRRSASPARRSRRRPPGTPPGRTCSAASPPFSMIWPSGPRTLGPLAEAVEAARSAVAAVGTG